MIMIMITIVMHWLQEALDLSEHFPLIYSI